MRVPAEMHWERFSFDGQPTLAIQYSIPGLKYFVDGTIRQSQPTNEQRYGRAMPAHGYGFRGCRLVL
jgi:hypothetical protein